MSGLLKNVHSHLTKDEDEVVVRGDYDYHHYLCDGVDDRGWGCGYRSLQTICSWLRYNSEEKKRRDVPTVEEIQRALVAMGDKPGSFVGSRDWIGSFELSICVDHFYDVPCRVVHVPRGRDHLSRQVDTLLRDHFVARGGPVMMGGDADAMSKCLLGVRGSGERAQLLVLDPHCSVRPGDATELSRAGWVAWRGLDHFVHASFYNLCLPTEKYREAVR